MGGFIDQSSDQIIDQIRSQIRELSVTGDLAKLAATDMTAEDNSCPDVFRPDEPVPWLVFSPTITFVSDGVFWESVMKYSGQILIKDN